MDAHHHHDEVQDSREKTRAALTGFTVALVWIALVGVVSFAWAGGFSAAH